jgi:hypothetical protein
MHYINISSHATHNKKYGLVVIPFGFPWNWPADHEQQTASVLAKQYHVVAFLSGEGFTLRKLFCNEGKIIQKYNGYIIFRPLYIIPFQRFRFIKKINTLFSVAELYVLLAIRNWQKHTIKYFWSFSLQNTISPKFFSPSSWIRIFDCMDDGVSQEQTNNQKNAISEKEIMTNSDIVFTNTDTLFQLKKHVHPNVHRVPMGFDHK